MKNLLRLCLLTLLTYSSSPADWLYTAQYPWVWDQSNGWNYLPESSDQVWNKSSQSWILNPYGNPVDFSALPSQDLWEITLHQDSNWFLVLQLNENGSYGPFIYYANNPYVPHLIKYTFFLNPLNGTALFHLQSTFYLYESIEIPIQLTTT